MESPPDSDGRHEPLPAPGEEAHQGPSDEPHGDEQFEIEILEDAGDEHATLWPNLAQTNSPSDLPEFLRRPWMPALLTADRQAGGYHPEKVYGVTRRFSLATVMLMMAGASVLLAAMNAFNVPPVISGTCIVLCFATAVGQMFLFGGRDPRRASIVVGAVFCTVGPLLSALILGVRVFGNRHVVTEVFTTLLLGVPLGAMAGYVAGCVVAGVLLMMELTESKLEGWRKARQPDDDPWPPPKKPGADTTSIEQPQ